MNTRRLVTANAWWATVLILLGLFAAYYFVSPLAVTYWKNTNVKTIMQSNARSCLEHLKGVQGCRKAFIAQTLAETGLQIVENDIDIRVDGMNVSINLVYKAPLVYPFTKTMLGSKKDRFKRYKLSFKRTFSGSI